VRCSGASSDCAFAPSQLLRFFFCWFLFLLFLLFLLFCFVGGGLLPFPEGATPSDQVYGERYWLSEAEDMEGGMLRYDAEGRKRNDTKRCGRMRK
jgi:hypothetical protein